MKVSQGEGANVGLFPLLLTGAVAGVVAAAVTSAFQAVWAHARLPPTDQPPTEPPTEVLADDLAKAFERQPLTSRQRPLAGEIVHYVMGAALGMTYALAASQRPKIRGGRGLAYGLGVWIIVEEVGLALVGLKPSPWRVPAAEHLFAGSSHLVFGFSLDAALAALQSKHEWPAEK